MTNPKRQVQPASLKWQANGELSDHDLFNLVCRLRDVEDGANCNELWRLGHKYPQGSGARPATVTAPAQGSASQPPQG